MLFIFIQILLLVFHPFLLFHLKIFTCVMLAYYMVMIKLFPTKNLKTKFMCVYMFLSHEKNDLSYYWKFGILGNFVVLMGYGMKGFCFNFCNMFDQIQERTIESVHVNVMMQVFCFLGLFFDFFLGDYNF